MAYQKSIYDIYTDNVAKLERLKININNKLMGSKTQVLRLIYTPTDDALPGKTYDALGYSEKGLSEWQPQTLANVIIKYPKDFMEIFQDRINGSSSSVGFDFLDIFPIEMILSTESIFTDASDTPVVLRKGDLIVDYFRDENNNKMPIVMRVERQRGQPWGKNIIQKKVELAMDFSNQPTEILDKIREWLDSV